MTAPSPVQPADSAPAFAITANGAPLDPSITVVSIEVWHAVNQLPRARLVLLDGSLADATFPVSSGAALAPGARLAIALGYGAEPTPVFSGVIERQVLEIAVNAPSRLVVEASDAALVMTLARGNAVFHNMTDSAVCEQLIGDAGLRPKVTATTARHATLVQHAASAWDMVVMRAGANGMVVMAEDGVVAVAAPDTSAAPALTLAYGDAILDLRLSHDAAGQLAGALPVASPVQQTRSRLAAVRGEVRFQGSALARAGGTVVLAGLGDRFSGTAWLSSVRHQLAEGQWFTTVGIGLAPELGATANGLTSDGPGQSTGATVSLRP